MPKFLPPAAIDDFSEFPEFAGLKQDFYDTWHNNTADIVGQIVQSYGLEDGFFFDGLDDSLPPVGHPWSAFPRTITKWLQRGDVDETEALRLAVPVSELLAPHDRYRFFELSATGSVVREITVRTRQQDEYCEWHADADSGGRIRRICFTCEPPEYWEEISKVRNMDLLVKLYQKYVNPAVTKADLQWPYDVAFRGRGQLQLFARKGDYNPFNRWNTTDGAMHLTQSANSLYAEIALAASAVPRYPVTYAPGMTDEERQAKLMACAAYGAPNRSSDPSIGLFVNDLARTGISVGLANPIGLYLRNPNLSGIADPDGNDISQACKNVVRATADGKNVLRMVIEPPAGATYTLDQCTVDGDPLVHGGQIAAKLTMTLFGVAKNIPGRHPVDAPCENLLVCTHPEAREYISFFSPQQFSSCSAIPEARWPRPYLGPATPGPAPFAAHEAVESLETLPAFGLESAVSKPVPTRAIIVE